MVDGNRVVGAGVGETVNDDGVGVHCLVQFCWIGLQDFPSKYWLGGQLHPSTWSPRQHRSGPLQCGASSQTGVTGMSGV